MSVPVTSNLDLGKNQLLNALLQILAGDHGSPVEGIHWYDATAKRVKYYDGSAVRQLVSQTTLDTAVALLIAASDKGAANGVATLDSGGKIPASQLPSSVMDFKGLWNASTNTPTLADGTGSAGDVYRVSVAGARNLGSGSVTYDVGDLVFYDGSTWDRSDATDAVTTVNGYAGTVTLAKGDIGLGNVDNTSDATKPVSAAQQAALDSKAPLASPALTGNPTAPTPTPGDNDTSIATTAFVTAAVAASGLTKVEADITGDGVATQFTVTHNRNSKGVSVTVVDVSADIEIIVDKKRPTVNTCRIDFAQAPVNGKVYHVTVIG